MKENIIAALQILGLILFFIFLPLVKGVNDGAIMDFYTFLFLFIFFLLGYLMGNSNTSYSDSKNYFANERKARRDREQVVKIMLVIVVVATVLWEFGL